MEKIKTEKLFALQNAKFIFVYPRAKDFFLEP